MEYFAPGLRELPRIAARLWHRGQLARNRRQLAAAETELGLLGWQQADFDEETAQRVDEIQHVEREQSRLHNAAAELAQTIRTITAQRTAARAAVAAQRAPLTVECEKIHTPLAELEPRLAALRKHQPDYDRRVADLDREQRDLDQLYSELFAVQPQVQQTRDELRRVRERLIAIPVEKENLRAQHERLAADLLANEQQAAEITERLTALDRQLRDLDAAAKAEDDKLAGELREREKEKACLEADVEKLERAKLDPYREIGRVLADSGVAPINQPHVFERVLALRLAVQEHEFAIATLRQSTAQENPQQLRISLALLAIIALACALLLGVLF